MSIIPQRKKSKKQKALKTAAKAKVVTKAPKTAAAAWTGKRSGKALKGALVAVIGIVTLKAIRKKRAAGQEPDRPEPQSYRATETPSSSQQTGATPSNPSPSGPTATAAAKEDVVAKESSATNADPKPDPGLSANAEPAPDPAQSATPPHGDKADPA